MRIKLTLSTRQLPVHYRMLFVSLIKEAIKKSDEELYKNLYIDLPSMPKKYSFAIYLSNFKKEKDVFDVDGATMTISSSDPRIAVALINGFQNIKKFNYKNWKMEIEKLELLKEKKINHPYVQFTTLSPILLEDKENKPLLIKDNDFEKEMNIVCNQQFQALYGRALKRTLKIVNYNMRKQVIQESNSGAEGRTLFFTGQRGTITLVGAKEDLQLIYQDGFLNRKSQGWGNLDVVSSFERGE